MATTPPQPSPEPARFDYFFDLPGELREQILHYICYNSTGYMIGEPLGHTTTDPEPASAPMALLMTNAQLHLEASAIFHSQNTFHINLSSGGKRALAALLGPDRGLFTPASAPARRRIRHVVLYLRKVGGQYASPVGPALDDMVLSGLLRDLEVRFRAPTRDFRTPFATHRKHDSSDDERIVQSAPFQSLLRLLADPYLERSVIKVAPLHWTLWCPFHRKVEERTKFDGALAAVEEEWLSVDVGQLLKVYGGQDGEWSILKIG